MIYAIETTNGAVVRARWAGRSIELIVFGANDTGMALEWATTLEFAIYRFNWLIERNGGAVAKLYDRVIAT